MERGRFVCQAVQRGTELGLEREQGRLGAALRVLARLVGQVELGSIARREADGLARLPLEQPGKLRGLIAAERRALAQLDGGEVMRHADEDDPHEKCVTGNARRTIATRRNPASRTYAARRPRSPAPRRRTMYEL